MNIRIKKFNIGGLYISISGRCYVNSLSQFLNMETQQLRDLYQKYGCLKYTEYYEDIYIFSDPNHARNFINDLEPYLTMLELSPPRKDNPPW